MQKHDASPKESAIQFHKVYRDAGAMRVVTEICHLPSDTAYAARLIAACPALHALPVHTRSADDWPEYPSYTLSFISQFVFVQAHARPPVSCRVSPSPAQSFGGATRALFVMSFLPLFLHRRSWSQAVYPNNIERCVTDGHDPAFGPPGACLSKVLYYRRP